MAGRTSTRAKQLLEATRRANAAARPSGFEPRREPASPMAGALGCGGDVRCMMKRELPRRRDAAEIAIRTFVGEIVRRHVTWVRADASCEGLEALLRDQDNDAVVVVDALAKPIGIISSSDLLRCLRDGKVAREVMTPVTQTLLETAPISFAIGVLGQRGLAHVPVVGADGALVGAVSAADVVAWLARQFGYDP